MNVLYEDNHIIAVNKPAGLLTQPTDIQNDSLEVRLKAWLKEKYNKPGNVFLGILHRLDRPVSGIVVFAKTSKALSRLNEAMRERTMHKTYIALVEGTPQKEEEVLEHYLRHDDYRAEICRKGDNGAKLARLRYKTLEKRAKNTLLEVKLETGRYHQIRAQLAAIGCPIVGDGKYGSKTKFQNDTIALHHAHMELTHPVTHAAIILDALPPKF